MPKLSLNSSKKTKHTPAGEIPVDWAWANLRKFCRPRQWTTIQSKDLLDKGYPVWGANGRIGFYSEYNHENSVVAVTCRGATCGNIHRIPPKSYVTGNAMCLDDLDKSQIVEGFLFYALSNGDVLRLISGSAQPQIIAADLGNLAIPLPSLPEQRRIADLLSTWDRSIATLESLLAAKERRKQALMQQLLSGRMRLPGFSVPWSVRHLGDVAENVSQRNNGKFSWDRLYAVTKADGMVPMREQVMGVSTNNCKLVKQSFFAYNPMRLNIGSLARWQRDEEVMVSGDYIVFRCKEGELEPRFFDHLRRTTQWQDFVNVGGSGSVRVRLYFKDIAPFKFPCPEFMEQKALADFFDTIERELTLHRRHLDTLRRQKLGLMQKLLTGEVRVMP